ncbi:MAG TPA: hypothetical protein PLX69_10320 [Leptospiraceae bacterium]|nr:hypothetical protein [Leptospiraceae bacterium]
MVKLIRKILENIVGTMDDIAFLTWNEKTSSKAKAERITTSIRSGNTPALAFAYSMDRQGCLSYPSFPKLTVLNFAYLSVNSVLSAINRLLWSLTSQPRIPQCLRASGAMKLSQNCIFLLIRHNFHSCKIQILPMSYV